MRMLNNQLKTNLRKTAQSDSTKPVLANLFTVGVGCVFVRLFINDKTEFAAMVYKCSTLKASPNSVFHTCRLCIWISSHPVRRIPMTWISHFLSKYGYGMHSISNLSVMVL